MNEFIKYSYWTVVVASMLLIGILVVFSFHLHFDKCETVDRQSLTTLLQQEHNQRWGVMNDSAMKNTKLDSLFSTWNSILVKKNDMLESQQKKCRPKSFNMAVCNCCNMHNITCSVRY